MTTPLTGIGATVGAPTQRDRLREATKELEAVFYGQLLHAMRDTVPQDGAIEHSAGEDMFNAMLDDRIAQLAAGQNDRGLASAMYRQLSKQLPAETSPVASTLPSTGAGHDNNV